MSAKKFIKLFSAVLEIFLLVACGSQPVVTPYSATVPAAQATWTAKKDASRGEVTATATVEPSTNTPVSSGFEPIGNVTVEVPQGRTNSHAITIKALRSTKYMMPTTYFLEGIEWQYDTGFVQEGYTTDIGIVVDASVHKGVYETDIVMSDDTGGQQTFHLTINVIGFCDFTVPAQGELPETFITLQDNQMRDFDFNKGRIKLITACMNKKPVYIVAELDPDCVDTIVFSHDGGWGCYNSQHLWISHLGGAFIMPWGQPDQWYLNVDTSVTNPPVPTLPGMP